MSDKFMNKKNIKRHGTLNKSFLLIQYFIIAFRFKILIQDTYQPTPTLQKC